MTQVAANYVYILVRQDLSPEQQAVQASHALIEAARCGLPPFLQDADHPHLVLLGVRDEVELHQAMGRLSALGVPFTPFYEPDLGDSLTAVCSGPHIGNSRRHFRRYSLLKMAEPSRRSWVVRPFSFFKSLLTGGLF